MASHVTFSTDFFYLLPWKDKIEKCMTYVWKLMIFPTLIKLCKQIFPRIEVFEISDLFTKTFVRVTSRLEEIIFPEDKRNMNSSELGSN